MWRKDSNSQDDLPGNFEAASGKRIYDKTDASEAENDCAASGKVDQGTKMRIAGAGKAYFV